MAKAFNCEFTSLAMYCPNRVQILPVTGRWPFTMVQYATSGESRWRCPPPTQRSSDRPQLLVLALADFDLNDSALVMSAAEARLVLSTTRPPCELARNSLHLVNARCPALQIWCGSLFVHGNLLSCLHRRLATRTIYKYKTPGRVSETYFMHAF